MPCYREIATSERPAKYFTGWASTGLDIVGCTTRLVSLKMTSLHWRQMPARKLKSGVLGLPLKQDYAQYWRIIFLTPRSHTSPAIRHLSVMLRIRYLFRPQPLRSTLLLPTDGLQKWERARLMISRSTTSSLQSFAEIPSLALGPFLA